MLVLHYKNEDLSLEDAKSFTAALSGIYQSSDKAYYVIQDSTQAKKYTSSEVRIEVGNWMKRDKELIEAHNQAAVFIMQRAMMKMLVKSVFAIQGYPVDFKIVKTFEGALEYLAEKGMEPLEVSQVKTPAELVTE